MEKIAMSLIFLSACIIATIQIRGLIKGSIPFLGFSPKHDVPLEPIEKKFALSAGVLFLLGLIALCASF